MKRSKEKAVPRPKDGISKRGKNIIIGGIVLLAAGFLVLTRTDPQGQNLASILSPFMIIGGYAVIAVGIVTPSKIK